MALKYDHDRHGSYPEKSLFDFDPPLYNLTPLKTMDKASWSPEFIAMVLKEAIEQGQNPLYTFYMPSPIRVDSDVLQHRAKDVQLQAYVRPPPLPELRLQQPIEFLEDINPDGNHSTFIVKIGSELRLLKTYMNDSGANEDHDECNEDESEGNDFEDHEPDASNVDSSGSQDDDSDSDECIGYDDLSSDLSQFHAEKDAYAHLLHYGACDAGIVPRCYGWLRLSGDDTEFVAETFEAWGDVDPPFGILLEYFPEATPISISNIDRYVADNVMRAMCRIHGSYVLHGDVASNNCLVLPDKRVVWVDFDRSSTPKPTRNTLPARRAYFWEEAQQTWSWLYLCLLPDKRIGLESHRH